MENFINKENLVVVLVSNTNKQYNLTDNICESDGDDGNNGWIFKLWKYFVILHVI